MIDISCKKNDFYFKNVSGIIFDKDGTITNSHFYWSEIILRRSRKILKEFELDKSLFGYVASSMGLDLYSKTLIPEGPIALKSRKEVVSILFKNISKFSNKITEKSLADIFLEIHEEFKNDACDFIKPIEGVIEFIYLCKSSKLKLALISSDTEENTKQVVNLLNLNECFDMVIGGDSGFGDKVNGLSALHICRKLNLLPNQVISIGDAPSDLYMARKADLKGTVLVESGQIDIKKLSNINDFCVHKLSDLVIS